MNPIQSQLYADHYNHLRLLRFLESEIICFEIDGDWHSRLPIILEILDYIEAYPKRRHHPIEDAALELLLKKNIGDSESIWGLRAEHTKLEALTKSVSQLFIALANDVVVSKNELVDISREFLARQFDHIYRENFEFYPLFEKAVTDEEWESINSEVDNRFGVQLKNALQQDYKQLYKAILRFDKEKNPDAIARSINSISAQYQQKVEKLAKTNYVLEPS